MLRVLYLQNIKRLEPRRSIILFNVKFVFLLFCIESTLRVDSGYSKKNLIDKAVAALSRRNVYPSSLYSSSLFQLQANAGESLIYRYFYFLVASLLEQ
jgi:hypothetical protein